jgi:hypothetical protein
MGSTDVVRMDRTVEVPLILLLDLVHHTGIYLRKHNVRANLLTLLFSEINSYIDNKNEPISEESVISAWQARMSDPDCDFDYNGTNASGLNLL